MNSNLKKQERLVDHQHQETAHAISENLDKIGTPMDLSVKVLFFILPPHVHQTEQGYMYLYKKWLAENREEKNYFKKKK